MEVADIIDKLQQYGPIIIVVIMYLEGLNLTGIPALVIMPAIGVYIGNSNYDFIYIFSVSLVASILGNLTYYIIAYKIGRKIYDKIYDKFPKMRKALRKAMYFSDKYGAKACFIGRIVPGARTFVSLTSGIFQIKFKDFFIYSSVGIGIWNFIFIFIGYFAVK